ncbi:alpha-amylase family glycosyl hydrolase [Tengunoibacter tsumagoiensis]|uniref:Alpha-amylase n=1 Tax=Tengunoibacter tsumagoiensis TaxID=2014871 RepID=A0A401ZYX1_9CHLR|nr:alpha-amylase family glycosyl hydrolase [Tengunoibacter tsumagoiensis]GCE12068.1 alpha-amylase [Tengunoibacter tsumagoiensis]
MQQIPSWWQTSTIYQIYPRSFQDSNGDGIGDLRGIINRLDYFRWLGIDTLWLSPVYPSPMADFGYDIANYSDIDPTFGTLADMDDLIREAHQCDLKILLDFVPNHTSDEHDWFKESRSNRTNAKRDWYIWRDPAPNGGPPNNWLAHFGGNAWAFDEQTGQYYLHLFHEKQPDLNWRNPEVQQAMYDVLRFWLKRGIDGFRVDVIWLLIKDGQLRDNPLNPDWKEGDFPMDRLVSVYSHDQPEVHEIIREMRTLLDSFGERVLIGEIYLPVPRLMQYYGENLDEAHLPFNFQFIGLAEWNAQMIRTCVDAYETALPAGAWPNWVLGNHDNARVVSRAGKELARVAQMLLLTLRGTPTCYYGDELGMQDGIIPLEMIHDPRGRDNPADSRDPERTPMQWDATPNAGFSPAHVQPWLPVSNDYKTMNVAVQREDKHSMLTLTRSLLTLRKSMASLHQGSYRSLDAVSSTCFAYIREHAGERTLIVLNFSANEQTISLSDLAHGQILLSTQLDREGKINLSHFTLRGFEGCLIALPNA